METSQARRHGDRFFLIGLGLIGGVYAILIVAMLLADLSYTSPFHVFSALGSREIRYAIFLSLLSSAITTVLSLWIGVALGYLLSRARFPGKSILDTLIDIPIVLPPLVVGLSLLILFQTPPGRAIQQFIPITYAVPGVILAQLAVSAAFAVRTMRVTFEQISPRTEQVAMTLGCSRAGAFWRVALPESWRGMLAAATLCWARSLGEFGPVLVLAGVTRLRTEVLPTTVFLELSVGSLEAAIAVSLLMVLVAIVILVFARIFGLRGTGWM